MIFNFYDIEALSNVFCNANYESHRNNIDLYYLLDTDFDTKSERFQKRLIGKIYEKNEKYTGTVTLYDLKEEYANIHMAKAMGVSDSFDVNNPDEISSFPYSFRPVCDTDPDYDESIHPYLIGYNSYNYDTTMLAIYFHEVFSDKESYVDENGVEQIIVKFSPTTAKTMRDYNDELFLPMFKSSMPSRLRYTYDHYRNSWGDPVWNNPLVNIRKSMLRSGRHLDVAKLNEKLSKVALKRLLGLLGLQILESEKLGFSEKEIKNEDELCELFAYNISDVLGTKELFQHKYYQAQFSLKKNLLDTYPETKYNKVDGGEYKPNISPYHVRKDRLTIDSSSAQIATKTLCPYGHLTDYPTVSFMYPSEKKAHELGIARRNILDETKAFFDENFKNYPELLNRFNDIYLYYKQIEGKNFNESATHRSDWGNSPEYKEPRPLSSIPKQDTNMFYYLANGEPSSCFVTFSTGGIHGAEYNEALYHQHM